MEKSDLNTIIESHIYNYLKCFAGSIGEVLEEPFEIPNAVLVYTGTPSTFNRIYGANFRGLRERKIRQSIKKVNEYYSDKNSSALWFARTPLKPIKFEILIAENHFNYQTDWRDMVLSLSQNIPENQEIPEIQVIKVLNSAQFKHWISIFCEGFEYESEEEVYDKMFQSMGFGDSLPHQYYLGYYNDEPSSICFSFADPDAIGLSCLTTLSKFRRKGCAKAIINQVLKDAISKECKILFTQVDKANSESKTLFQKLGFVEGDIIKIYGFKP